MVFLTLAREAPAISEPTGQRSKILVSELRLEPTALSSAEEAELDRMVLPPPPNWTGDFTGMRERRVLRILVPFSRTFYYLDGGQQRGFNYEYGKALEGWLDRTHPVAGGGAGWQVLFIPVRRDQLLTGLQEGMGDLAAGGLTITKGRSELVAFTEPIARNVNEVLVTGPTSKPLKMLEDLAGREITVRASSSYYEHLLALNEQFMALRLKPMKLVRADEWLEAEDLLEMVDAGLVKSTVVDRYLAELWGQLYRKLKIHEAPAVHTGGEIAWAMRQDSPELRRVMNEFVQEHRVGTVFGNILVSRYLRDRDRVVNATSTREMRKYKQLVGYFRRHGANTRFDYLMLLAQGYQESRLDQRARSAKGAVGVMQLLPSTAADPAIGITDIDKYASRNIEAGAKYLRLLADTYLNEDDIDPINRTLMAFAAYNAGPGNLRKFRRLAEKNGHDPDIWFHNVEYTAARLVGQETVRYVANIYKYYIAYKAVEEQRLQRKRK